MFSGSSTKIIAACMALTAFAVAVVAGVAAENGVDVVLTRALWSMGLGGLVGIVIGAAAEAAVATTIRDLSAQGDLSDSSAPLESSAPKKATS
ncbi:MAG: hypothetical protein ACT4PL_05895 [Phycisphaerales bacterium]